MKTKITSLFLIISILLSLLTVYSFAAESSQDGNKTSLQLHYKNTYGDAEDDVGGNRSLSNAVNSTFEVKKEANGNNYGYYNFNDSTKNVFMEFLPSETVNIGPDMLGYMIFEFDFNDFGNKLTTSKFLDVNSGKGSFTDGRVAASDILNVANDSNGNYFYLNNDKSNKIYIKSNTWTHVRCEFSVLSTNATKYSLKCYIGDESFESSNYTYGNPKIIYQIRLGSTNSTNTIFGLDNIVLYTTPDKSLSAPSGGVLAMKIGAENARLNNNQIELTHTPMLINGNIYCPVDVIERFTGKVCPENYTVILENAKYIHFDNIRSAFGVDAKSYAMGLVLIGNYSNYVDENASYDDIANFMKTFVFNIPSADEIISDVSTNTNGFDHPYLIADSDKFAELRIIYSRGTSGKLTNSEDLLLYNYIKSYIDSAKSTYKNYCSTEVSAKYSGITKVPVNNNYSKYQNNGYDNGGRLSVDTTPLLYFAFAYQITGEMNYARAAYDYMLCLGDWNHWGPDHFLNCADTAAPFAVAYDWLYDAFVELNTNGEVSKHDNETYDKSKLATILFTHVIIPGYVQSNNLTCPWPGSAGSRYATKTSNWNAVCVSGVVMAALMLLEEDVSTAGMTFATQKKNSSTSFTQTTTKIEEIGNKSIHTGLSTYADYAAKLTSMNLGTLAQYGLNQYVPDGSYIESPSYWSYGTNTFFRLIASLLSAAGDDYGFMDAWGIDTTCYFAVHSESSDYNTWNFNDGSVGKQDSSFFFFVGDYYGDNNLVKVRKKHLSNGKSYSLYDILFYDTSIVGEPELSTEYLMTGIDAFSVRSSWDKGAIYAGIMGGPNTVSHGQMDAGAFIYHNNGKIWFTDLGADNYNFKYGSQGYFSNFNLYRVGAEGHNMLLLTSQQSSLPYGQDKNAKPKIVSSYSGTDGGYAVLDMSSSYGTHVTSGKRGMLFTNSRSTVVIQDEYVFNGAQTAYWFGHYQLATGYVDDVVISADGRTAFMISGDDIIRVSIVSDNKNLTFEIMDCYTYVLNTTLRTDRNTMGQAATENNRDSFRKLAIKCENVTELNLAVVIEEVSGYEIGCSYDFTKIDEWTVNPDGNSVITEKFKADFESGIANVGSYHLNTGNGTFVLDRYNKDSLSCIGIVSNARADAKSGALTFYFSNNVSQKLSKSRYLTFDADIFTDSSFIDNSSLGINIKMKDGTTSFVSLLTLVDDRLTASGAATLVRSEFVHITLIVDTYEKCVWIYTNDTLLARVNGILNDNSDEILSFELKLPATSDSSVIYLDDVLVRSLGTSYDSSEIAALLSMGSSISTWIDKVAYESKSMPLAEANGSIIYNNSELQSVIANGYDVTLYRNVTGMVNVTAPVTVHTNGYTFRYVSSEYLASKKGDDVVFAVGSVTVKWHLDDQVITETYYGSSIASFKGSSSNVGRIIYSRIDNDGGVTYKFFTTGWSDSEDGKSLSSADMVVSKENYEFWLVNNVDVNCMFVKIASNGSITTYNSEQQLRTLISENNGTYDIVLCRDVELLNTSAISIGKSGKNLYLNGHTIYHRQYDAHVFNYNNGSTGNFNIIGPGSVEADGARTIFTSSSSTDDTTSNFGIVASNVTFKVCGQFADLRVGQHKFTDCTLIQSNTTKTFIALWNKNSSFLGGGVPENLLTMTFDGCTISTSAGFVSYSGGSYSRVYVNDTALNVGSYLIETSSSILYFEVTGNSEVMANSIFQRYAENYTTVTFGNGVSTNLDIPSVYLKKGTAVTNNYDTALPYRISDNYATVTWKDAGGNVILSEYVAVGVTLRMTNSSVSEYLKKSGNVYTYNLLTVSDNSEIVLTPVLKESSPIMLSMSIENDLTMYLYIDKSDMDSKIAGVLVDGVRIRSNAYETVNVNGKEYYRYSILSFKPSQASNAINIVIEYSDGTVKTLSTSAVRYLEELLVTSENDAEKTLIIKILKYIQSAQMYFGEADIFEQDKISGIIEEYKEYDLVFGGLEKYKSETGAISNVVRSACFNMSASVRIRFYFNLSYSGSISITFNGETFNYTVTNGFDGAYDYVEIVMPVTHINETLVLSDGTNIVEYGLGAYANAMNNTDYKLHNMLVCLSEYSSAAKAYVGE